MAEAQRYAQWIVENQDKAGTPEFEAVARAYEQARQMATAPQQPAAEMRPFQAVDARPDKSQMSYLEQMKYEFSPQRLAGSQTGRLFAGALAPVAGAVQLGAMGVDALTGLAGKDTNYTEAVTEALRNYRDYARGGMDDPDAFDLEGLAGTVATGAGLASKIPQAASMVGRGIQNVLTGGALSAIQPALSENPRAETATQFGLGAVTGAVVPLLTGAGRIAYNRLSDRGIERAAGRLANEAAGPRRDEIVQLLRQNRNPVAPATAGEVAAPAGSAEFSALQRRVASAADPSSYVEAGRTQNQAILNALRSVGGTADDLATQTARAQQQIGQLYDDAFNAPLQPTPALTQMLVDDPFVAEATRIADRLARSEGVPQGTTRYLHLIKKGLDDLVDSPAAPGGIGPTERRAINIAREKFVTELGKSNPVYNQARIQAAEIYRPLTQMQVGQGLEQRLSPALLDTGAESPALRSQAYAQALRDAPGTIRRATGFRGATSLEDVMEPAQMDVLNRVGEQLSRSADFNQLAREGTERVNQLLGEQFSPQVAPMLSRVMMMMNNVMKRTASGASERSMQVLAQKMRNPQEMAELMQAATQAERAQIKQLLQAIGATGAAGTVSESYEAADWLMGGVQ